MWGTPNEPVNDTRCLPMIEAPPAQLTGRASVPCCMARQSEDARADEAFYGGRKQKGNRGRAQNSDKALIVCAVEKRRTVGAKSVMEARLNLGFPDQI